MAKTSSLLHYASLTPSSSRTELSSALGAIHDPLLDVEAKKALAQLILDDLRARVLDNTISRISEEDAPQALRALKDLGYAPEVATVLAIPSNLRCLLNLSGKFESCPENSALRCIANTVLLNEPARTTFIGNEVDGGNACIDLLQKSTSTESIFLASRILFLCTASISASASFIQWLVEHKRQNVSGSGTAIDIIAAKTDELVNSLVAGKDVKTPMTDLLKLTFNLCAHYPKLVDCEVQSPDVKASGSMHKVMGDYWSPRLDSLLPPLLRAFHNIPPSSPNPLIPPLSHVVHALITIPITPAARQLWFGSQPSSSISHSSPSESASSSSSTSPSHEAPPVAFKEPKSKPFERALSVLSGRRSLSRSSLSRSTTPTAPDTACRAYELLDIALRYFLPDTKHPDDDDDDDGGIGDQRRAENDSTLNDISPLGILLARICLADEDAKLRLRNRFVPPSIDRTKPLEERPDLLGRCLRLLVATHHDHERLKTVIGEMFFAMFDSDPTTMAAQLGYGNVAGFLFHKGISGAPTKTRTSGGSTMSAGGLPINPITGMIEKEREPDDMTEEEKELEAEKLFALFERLEKTGALPRDQNPIRRAMERSKIQ